MSDVGGGAGSGSQTDLCPALILTELTRPPGRDSRGRSDHWRGERGVTPRPEPELGLFLC